MTRLNAFATKRPLLFVLATIVAWMLLGGVFAGLTAVILQVDFTGALAQSLGMVVATLCLLLVAGRLGWLRPVEEIMFRGIVLYVLARRWGGTAGGLLASLVVASLLFGSLHMLQAFAGASLTLAAITTLNSALSGFWWGALVLRGRSVWPAVLLHILSNSIVQIQALGTPGFEMTVSNTMTATLLELPLAVIAVIVLLRWPPRSVVLETPGA